MSKIKIGNGSSFKEVSNNNFVNETEQVVMQEAKEVEEYQDKRIQRVLPEKSTMYSKSFALNDGTIKSVFGSNPINYFDEKEKVWKEIDSTLKEEGENYVSNLGKYKAKIKKGGEVAGVTVGDENTYVEWQFLGTKIENNRYCLKDKKSKPSVKVENLKKEKDIFNYGKLKYLSCDEGVDIEYITQGNGVKENIIVNKKSEEYKYYFSLRTKNLSIKLDETESNILFYCVKEGVEEVEFAIPAPYMYDGKNEHSNEVSYELDKVKEGEYIFIVEADANWINSEERVLPITIDPQLIVSHDWVFGYEYEIQTVGGDWVASTPTGTTNLLIAKTEQEETRSIFSINKGYISVLTPQVLEVKINFPITEINSACSLKFKFGSSEVIKNLTTTDTFIMLDVTREFKNVSDLDDFIVTIQGNNLSTGSRVVLGETEKPVLIIEYLSGENYVPTIKSLSFAGGVTGDLNLETGEVVSRFVDVVDDNLGINIAHSYKLSEKDYSVGENFRLNIYENFVKNGDNKLDAQYIYTDEQGNKHKFTEYFYYTIGKERKYINKSQVSINSAGELSFGEYKVIREFHSSCGLQAITQYDGLKNINLLNQKKEEVYNLEKNIEDYHKYVSNYVIFVKEGNEGQNSKYSSLKLSLEDKKFNLTGKDSSSNEIILKDVDLFGYLNNADNLLLQANESVNFSSLIIDSNNTLLQHLIASQESRKESFNDNYNNYLIYIEKLTKLKKQTPINYVILGNLHKGFNEVGQLVTMFIDKQEDSVGFAYKELNGVEVIDYIYNDNDYRMSFEYENKIGEKFLLSRIISSDGTKVEFNYNNEGYLSEVYQGENTITFNYSQERIMSIEGTDLLRSELSYTNGLLTNVTDYSKVSSINYEGYVLSDTLTELASVTFSYEFSNPTIMKQVMVVGENLREKFVFDTSGEQTGEAGNLKEYYKEEYGLVTQAELYKYYPPYKNGILNTAITPRKEKMVADYEELYLDSIENFSASNVTTETSYLDKFYNVSKKRISNQFINPEKTMIKGVVVEYEYDTNNKKIRERNIETFTDRTTNEIKDYVTLLEYYYDSFGRILKLESYIEGEDKLYGRNIEEYVYNNKGMIINKITYNTLSPASKVYETKEYNEQGKVSKEFDATGEYFTEINYSEISGKQDLKVLPNGSKIGLGEDIHGNSMEITQSTQDGEENSNQSFYTKGILTKVISNDFVVDYTYEKKKRLSKIAFNGQEIFNTTYTDGEETENDVVQKRFLARGNDGLIDVFETEYNNKGKVVSARYANCDSSANPNFTTQIQYTYNEKGNPTQVVDSVANITHGYEYDSKNRLTKHTYSSNSTEYGYDKLGNMVNKTHKLFKEYYGGTVYTDNITYNYEYSDDSRRKLINLSVGNLTENYVVDGLDRTKKINYLINENVISKEYGYYKNGNHATDLVNSVFYKTNGAVTDREYYTYDSMNNITSVSKNGIKQKEYKYDTLGRIIYENNIDTGKEISYTYDRQGNILSKVENGTKIEYTYDQNGFKLLSYGGQNYTYDNLGNPLNINSTYYNARWTKAHLLTTLNASSHAVNFIYDGNGLLNKISIGGSSAYWNYIYEDGKLVRRSQNGSTHTDFLYGKEGLIGFVYGGETYLYQKNIFGDIVKITNSAGVVVAEYSYTAFGECTIVSNVNSIATINPFRYRGYLLESNSGLYYLKTRFYNPITGRFISPDDTKYLKNDVVNGLNLYAYSNNNPVMYIDSNGTDAILILDYEQVAYFGHVGIALQDDNGKWYYVDYTCQEKKFITGDGLVRFFEAPIDKEVYFTEIDDGELYFDYDLYWYGEGAGNLDKNGNTQVYIKGDFSAGLTWAKETHDNLNESGYKDYDLLANNCSNFVQDVLKQGECADPILEEFIESHNLTVPRHLVHGVKLKKVESKIKKAVEPIKKVIKKIRETVSKFFKWLNSL